MTGRISRATALLSALLLSAAALAGAIVAAPPAGAYPNPTVDLVGHGFGHGRGLGQYGSLGYAIDQGLTYKQILGRYYSNTGEGNIGNPEVTIRLTRFDAVDTIVQQEQGAMTTNAAPGVSFRALKVHQVAANTFAVQSGTDCSGGPAGWQTVGTITGPVVLAPTTRNDDHTNMLQACNADGSRWYRGQIETYDGPQTLNRLDMEGYLKGVVPRESPASWADLGGGRGIEALRSQAVAARSYAQAEDRPGPSKTCDTTSCQVYGGFAQQINGGGYTALEDVRSNRAIADTAGEVRMLNGVVARTEFSSSTGGYTAGGTFPAVSDAGDETASNPNHTWRTSIAVGTIEAKYAKGTLLDVKVLERNGLGEDGGRVVRMRLEFSGGNVDLTGDEFRLALGLKSNWFKVEKVASFPYHVATRDGGVFSFGGAEFHGSLPGIGVRTPAKDITEGPGGYWLLGDDGGVFSFDVPFYGSMGGQHLNKPVVGMEGTADRQGYWLVAGDGGIFTFGDAPFFDAYPGMKGAAAAVDLALKTK